MVQAMPIHHSITDGDRTSMARLAYPWSMAYLFCVPETHACMQLSRGKDTLPPYFTSLLRVRTA